jgi:mannose-6-phosphate isomerase-like protein (cupin superfamily)
MVESIWIGEKRCALVLRSAHSGDGIEFFTRDQDSLQLGYMRRERGYRIRPHVHQRAPRTIEYTNEVLIVRSGRVRVDFYDDSHGIARSLVLEPNDIILLMEAGHGFEMLEDAEIVEVKQGPYVGEIDKVKF